MVSMVLGCLVDFIDVLALFNLVFYNFSVSFEKKK